MNRILKISMVGAMVAGLSACGSECSEEDLKQKMMDISTKITSLASSGDMTKMMSVSAKVQQIGQQASSGNQDLQAACDAADEILDEL